MQSEPKYESAPLYRETTPGLGLVTTPSCLMFISEQKPLSRTPEEAN